MYKIVDIDKKKVYVFDAPIDMLDFLSEDVDDLDRDSIEDELEVCGVATVANFTILDLDCEEKSDAFDFMEAFIDNMDKLK